MNSLLPQECSGVGAQVLDRGQYLLQFVVQQTSDKITEMNLMYLSGASEGHLNSEFDPSLKCNDVNISSTHTVTVADRMVSQALGAK